MSVGISICALLPVAFVSVPVAIVAAVVMSIYISVGVLLPVAFVAVPCVTCAAVAMSVGASICVLLSVAVLVTIIAASVMMVYKWIRSMHAHRTVEIPAGQFY
jgi:hypothetical protein